MIKSPVGYAQPRRLAAQKKPVRLNLRRSAVRAEEEIVTEPKNQFWKWFGLVALLHVAVICAATWWFCRTTPPPPPEPFISLLPEGDVVKGTPGAQQAPKVGHSTPAPAVHHSEPPPQPAAIQPPSLPTPERVQPRPVIQPDAPLIAQEKIVTPPKIAPPKPKVKVDLNLADGPVPLTEKPVVKKPTHLKKPVLEKTTNLTDASDRATEATPDNTGLSKEQIARELGQKLQNAGVNNAVKIGPSGSSNTKSNPYADFYAAVRDQVMNRWQSPNLTDESAVNPLVQIHVETDGSVPPERVTLLRSSGNPIYDDSALDAARNLGHLLQPLPEGCPPDISITFKLTR